MPRQHHPRKRVVSPAGTRRAFLKPRSLNECTGGLLGSMLTGVLGQSTGDAAGRYLRVSRRAMACDFTLFFPAHSTRGVDAGCAALDEIERLEHKLSVYIAGSDVSRVNRDAFDAPVTIDGELMELFSTAARISNETEGAFDITAGRLIKAWGFFRGPRHVPSEPERQAALKATGMSQVQLDAAELRISYRAPGLEINLGAIGKGYAIDRAVEVVRREFQVSSVLMHGGQSSLKGLGAPPEEPRGWKVGIGDPFQPARFMAAVWLRDRALGTSGAANQFFEEGGRRYGHVLDPRTGWPAEGIASASVLAPTGAEADALSTAFYVGGVEVARRHCEQHPGVAALMVTGPRDGSSPLVHTFGLAPKDFELFPPPSMRLPIPAREISQPGVPL